MAHKDAKKIVLQKFVEPNKTFAEVLRSTINNRNSTTNTRTQNPPINSIEVKEPTVEKPADQSQPKAGAQKRDASSDSDNDSRQPNKRTHIEIESHLNASPLPPRKEFNRKHLTMK